MIELTDSFIEHLKTLKDVEGDFAEFGVYTGRTLFHLLPMARRLKKLYHGIDSFEGLPELTKEDHNEEIESKVKSWFFKGAFKTDKGDDALRRILLRLEYTEKKDYFLWRGWIPQVLEEIPKDLKFSFVYLDLDLYVPTWDVLKWLIKENRLPKGAIIGCDDYIQHWDIIASQSIKEFLIKYPNDFELLNYSEKNVMTKLNANPNYVNFIDYEKPHGQILFRKIV